MKVFSVITIFCLGLYLQGCAPRLDYGGHAVLQRAIEKGSYGEIFFDTFETIGPSAIVDVSPVALTIRDMQLSWHQSYVTYSPKTMIHGDGFSINFWDNLIIVNEDRQYVATITPEQEYRIFDVLMGCINVQESQPPTPATSPAIRAGQ